MKGEVARLHEELFFEQTYHAAYEPMRAVRTERYLYLRRFDHRESLVLPNTDDTPAKREMIAAGWEKQPRHQEMFHDIYFDPDQKDNLIDRPEYRGLVRDFRASLERWMEETDDPLCRGSVPLPKGVIATNADAFSPDQEPFITGE